MSSSLSELCLSGIYRNEEPEAEDPWAVIWSCHNQKFLRTVTPGVLCLPQAL